MANLAEAVDATETDWLVSADIPDTVDFLTVESEVVRVTATFPAQYQRNDGSTSASRIRVIRGAGGTTAASHADGTALTPLIPPSAAGGGGGGVTVDNTVDPPAEVTTLVAPGATIAGDEATLAAGVQQLRLLGPFPIAFDAPDLSSGDIFVADIAEDALVISAFVTAETAWVGSGSITVQLWLVEGDWDGSRKVYDANLLNAPLASDQAGIGQSQESVGFTGIYWIAGPSTRLSVQVDGPDITDGSLNVYALIAEPVA